MNLSMKTTNTPRPEWESRFWQFIEHQAPNGIDIAFVQEVQSFIRQEIERAREEEREECATLSEKLGKIDQELIYGTDISLETGKQIAALIRARGEKT
jgi:hypothetical protein